LRAILTFISIHQVAFYVICVVMPLYNRVMAGFAEQFFYYAVT